MQVKKRVFQILQADTLRQSLLTINATILSGILGLVFYMMVARNLGPSNFGIFAVATATLALVADIGDLGTDTGLIRFVSKYRSDKNVALKFLKLGFKVKMLVWFLVAIFGWLFSSFISNSLFHKPELVDSLRLSFLGVGGALFLSFANHALQAYQRYKVWSFGIVGSNLLRLIFVAGLILTVGVSLNNLLIVYILIPFLFFAMALLFLPGFFGVADEQSVAREFFRFNRWIFLVSIIAAVSSRADIYLLTRLLPIEKVGIYSAAVQLTSFIPQLFFAIATVAAPKLASFKSNKEALNYLKKLQGFVLAITILGLVGIPLGYLIIQNIYGTFFIDSFLPFVILYFSQLIFLIALPTHQVIFYYFAKPQIFVPVALSQLLIVTGLGWLLISSFGIVGASLAVLLGNLLLFLAPASWVIYQFRKVN